MMYIMALVAGKTDVMVIAGDFCQKCAVQKLGILRQWPITKDELSK